MKMRQIIISNEDETDIELIHFYLLLDFLVKMLTELNMNLSTCIYKWRRHD